MSIPDPIHWSNSTRKLADLIPWRRNPRQIKTAQAKRLNESLSEFGQVELIVIGPGNELYNGHQRLHVLMATKGPEYEVEVRVSSRPLTEEEREKLTTLLHLGAVGSWNWDELANWNSSNLIKWGFSLENLQSVNLDANGMRQLLASNYNFAPGLAPETGTGQVTDADIAKKNGELQDQFHDETQYLQMTCPNCGHDFYVARKDLK